MSRLYRIVLGHNSSTLVEFILGCQAKELIVGGTLMFMGPQTVRCGLRGTSPIKGHESYGTSLSADERMQLS